MAEQGEPPGRGVRPKGTDPVVIARANLKRKIARAQGQMDGYQRRAAEAAARGGRPIGRKPLGSVEDYSYVKAARAALEQALHQAEEAESAGSSCEEGSKTRYRNVTDPDARFMPTRRGWITGYNNQLSVSADQLILAVRVEQNTTDLPSFIPMLEATQHAADLIAGNGGADADIGVVLADAGYRSRDNVTAPGPDRLIATGKRRDDRRRAQHEPTNGPPPVDADPLEAMDHRLRTPEGQRAYRDRGHIVEGANGQLKDVIGLRQFARRGLPAVTSELHFAAAVHNMLKLFRAQPATA